MKKELLEPILEIELETKDVLILVCIFAATGHIFVTLIFLWIMILSARDDLKKRGSAPEE